MSDDISCGFSEDGLIDFSNPDPSRLLGTWSIVLSCCGNVSSLGEMTFSFSSGLVCSFSNVSKMLCLFDFHVLSGETCFAELWLIAATALIMAARLFSLGEEANS